MKIKTGGLDNPQVIELLQTHHDDMLKHSPVESVHALDLSGLKLPSITFWSAWIEDKIAGCGAIKELDFTHGEIKSMRTSSDFTRQGVAAALLKHMVAEAKSRNYHKLSLETGTSPAFLPAQNLYQHFDFKPCAPFADYQLDPYSMFMSRSLT